MGRFIFLLSSFVVLGMLAIQAEAGKFPNTNSPRKMMVHRTLLIADPPAGVYEKSESGEDEIGKGGEAPESLLETEHHHHSDKSVAGGGVIIGGLVTAIFATVYCYIRVTRKKSSIDQDGLQKL